MGQSLACLWKRRLVLEGGTTVRVGAQIAEGGFSFVFTAVDSQGRMFALKRIRTQSTEQVFITTPEG